jgi:hypothetical protein
MSYKTSPLVQSLVEDGHEVALGRGLTKLLGGLDRDEALGPSLGMRLA